MADEQQADEGPAAPGTPDTGGSSEPPRTTGDPERSASQDLADGLELMLRAAKKAARHVDPQNIETIGRRALDNLEALNKKRVDEIKDKAKRSLDRRRIEEIAEDAGKELLRVVDRVAERVDSLVSRTTGPSASGERKKAKPGRPFDNAEAKAPVQEDTMAPDIPSGKRVRIEDD